MIHLRIISADINDELDIFRLEMIFFILSFNINGNGQLFHVDRVLQFVL